MTRARTDALLLAPLLAWFLGVSLWQLDAVPPVYEDEPWQASTGWKLASDGVLGSDMFAGLHRMEARYYGYMPLHALVLAAMFRAGGVGLLQARVVSVALGLVTLLLAYVVARRIADRPTALAALVLLVGVSFTGITRYMVTGIPLLDTARIARYDMAVPVFGLAALVTWLSAVEHRRLSRYALTGLLAGLAGLAHVYGAFWLAAFALLAAWNRAGWRVLVALCAGFALPWLFYLGYVLQDVEAWRGQTAGYASRFDLLDWRFYWDNLRAEPRRYFREMSAEGWRVVLRPGVWATIAATAATLRWLVGRAIRGDQDARALAVPLLLFPTLFALVIQIKLTSYLVLFVPVAAVAMAWGLTTLWRHARARSATWGRVALAAAVGLVLVDGSARIARLGWLSETTTPIRTLQEQLHAPIPPGSRVLGLHTYWFGFEDTDYRSWLVPWLQAFPYAGPARTIEDALDAVSPHFIILDPAMHEALDRIPERGRRVRAWMRDRGFVVVVAIDDPTYGRIDVFRSRRGNGAP